MIERNKTTATQFVIGFFLLVFMIVAIHTGIGALKNLANEKHLFQESDIPMTIDTEILKGSIIIYYKDSCRDCVAVADDLESALRNVSDVYFVNTESEQGATLLAIYPVTHVPTGVYIQNNVNIPYIQKQLYKSDESDNVVLDTENLNYILQLQSEGQ